MIARLLLLLLPASLQAISVSPEELAERRNWVTARFEGRQPPPRTEPGLMVLANHGPVLQNARAGKPLCIAGQSYARGLLAHAPSKLLIRLPGPGKTFSALVGIDSNEQTSGGRGSVNFSVEVRGEEKFRYLIANLDKPGTPQRFTGSELLERGLPIPLPAPRSSGLYTYKRER